jgi:hypothetical protein
MKNRKFSYHSCLNVIVLICLIANSIFLLQKIVGQASMGELLQCANGILAISFLLIYLNLSDKIGAILYHFSFLCYLFINIFLLPDKGILTISTFIRLTACVWLIYQAFFLSRKFRGSSDQN